MRRLVRLMLALAAIAAVLWLGWTPIQAVYFKRRAVLEDRRVSLAADVERYLDGVKDHDRVEGAIQAFVARTLGGDLETVDHRLRSRLGGWSRLRCWGIFLLHRILPTVYPAGRAA